MDQNKRKTLASICKESHFARFHLFYFSLSFRSKKILSCSHTVLFPPAVNAQRKQQQRPGGRQPPATRAPVEAEENFDAAGSTDQCPEPNGYFADAYQCDKYYECREGKITEKLCPDGMVFNDYSSQVEKCDLPFNLDCSQRPERRK